MIDKGQPFNTIIDFITGNAVPEIGSEANRQKVERFLVVDKGFAKSDIEVDTGIEIVIDGEVYRSQIDLVVTVEGKRFMVIKCVAASLGSWEREILSAARLLDRYQIPLAVVADGKTAIVLDTLRGKKVGEGLGAIPSKAEAKKVVATLTLSPLPEKRHEKEKLIFRSYDSMNVNVRRNL
jgi:hypothetical protein